MLDPLVLTFFAALFGAIAGVWLTLRLTITKQGVDFGKVIEYLQSLHKHIATDGAANTQRLESAVRHLAAQESALQTSLRELAALRAASEAAPVADLRSSMDSLKGSYEKLQSEVATLPTKIVREFRDQQEEFLRSIQTEFSRTVENSKGTLEQALLTELAPLVPSIKDQKALTERLVELTGYAMHAMGRYQLEIVEKQSSQALERTGQRVTDTVQDLKNDVKEVKKRLDEVMLLPVPYSPNR